MRRHNRRMRWAVVWLFCIVGSAGAVEVWTPYTGQVSLETLPRGAVRDRVDHALALIAAGQWAGGVAELRELIAAHPQAEWVGQARLAMARGLIGAGRSKMAFEELSRIIADYKGTPLAEEARALQEEAARFSRDVDEALRLYDRLIGTSSGPQEAARLQKEKADAAFRAGRYMEAQDEYRALITYYPTSEWVPYAVYQSALCEWRMAQWLGLGLEGVRKAEAMFREFARLYPAHELAGRAEAFAEQARKRRAALNRRVAELYMQARRKPWAAVPYLQYMADEFADLPEGQWAAEQLERLQKTLRPPLAGTLRPLPLEGVEPNTSAGGEARQEGGNE